MTSESDARPIDPWRVVAITALVMLTAALGALAYLLLDVLLLVFLGIVLAAAVQPWHERLCHAGIPKGLALLLIYLPFLIALAALCFFVGPLLFEQLTAFAAAVPDAYSGFRADLLAAPSALQRLIGNRLPTFDALTRGAAALLPNFFQGALQFTASVLAVFAYFVTVLAIAFYWTMELPRIERLVLSLLPVARRARTLTMWHEIERTLGAFMRGQAVLMLIIGVASGIGYLLIGLPNVLLLAVLAGLMEAVPVVGPVLAAIPAVMVASQIGIEMVALTIALAVLIQGIENNILVPRVMSEATGTSPLVGLLAVLGFGILYGVLGVFVAIPVAAVVQIVLAQALMESEEPAEATHAAASPESMALTRARAMQQQVRLRLRQRESRMGIDPDSVDHRVDALDQQIEGALERLARFLAPSITAPSADAGERRATLAPVTSAIDRLESLSERVGSLLPADPKAAASDEESQLTLAALEPVADEVKEAVDLVQSITSDDSAGLDTAAATSVEVAPLQPSGSWRG